ncbi:hypothetical protein BBBOND_0307610 [Babesia bigemina]|uniref:Uncharacterized protein n=1 Tax=Babesia bigemina TaxID=5866 RepID=A0A061DA73_BABBI|nr:hypothetical protein BBBOND_0307610 [Babesia bigemina]CDR96857.1 hypothetical protein BBBOND_0307610 [Babesia bigemina]|eukprot:XP_012769043.1 hypothetical protein BBBOND_0307610 [Babesia bigemina]
MMRSRSKEADATELDMQASSISVRVAWEHLYTDTMLCAALTSPSHATCLWRCTRFVGASGPQSHGTDGLRGPRTAGFYADTPAHTRRAADPAGRSRTTPPRRYTHGPSPGQTPTQPLSTGSKRFESPLHSEILVTKRSRRLATECANRRSGLQRRT